MYFDAILPRTSLPDVPDMARAAEQIGFDALWISETQHDPFLPCALIAEHTARIGVGTAIAVAFARSPTVVAYAAWDLAAQSHGRFMLGLGTQVKPHIERRFGMPWPASVVGKFREYILAIRALWDCWQSGERLNFRGAYYKLTLMSPFFNPGPIAHPRVPIYMAGVNPGLATLAGEVCDGFLVHPFHSPRYLREVIQPAVSAGLQKVGRSRPDIAVSVTAFAATSEAELQVARSQLAFYASTPSYRPVMSLHGWDSAAEQLSARAAQGEWDQMPSLITEEMLAEFCLFAHEEDLPTALQARYAGIADRLTLYSAFQPGEKDNSWKRLRAGLQHRKGLEPNGSDGIPT
jgi:probable F420-dependent oxidoreductase